MNKKLIRNIIVVAVLLIVFAVLSFVLKGEHNLKCGECDGTGMVDAVTCEVCSGSGVGDEVADSNYYSTVLALAPPIIAIVLALVTKEVYSSLFIGVVAGALLYSNFDPIGAVDAIVNEGLIANVGDSWNAGILIFLVLLGIMVALINAAGGSAAFGRWAKIHVKTRTGAQLATFALGVLIFIDDYFNCLTVGSVMRPVTDGHKISRAKFAYIIDATAAPICMIAPISSWAAAVTSVVGEENGLTYFVRAIPYNFYSLLTIVMIITILLLKFDFGPMRRHELNALDGDLFSENDRVEESADEEVSSKGKVIDLVLPVLVLIVCCIVGMIYTGGFFDAESGAYLNLASAFAGSDASAGLSWGALIATIISVLYLLARRVISFKTAMNAIPKGFCAMVPAIIILVFAWTLGGITRGMLGADIFVKLAIGASAEALSAFLPAVIFLIAFGLAFATGTSWGTFGILLPIVITVFSGAGEILIIAMSACLAGAVCGDHCSPISDTTIMASAGAQCNHVNHVSTQLPYALTVACVSTVAYILAGFIQNWLIVLPIAILLMVATLLVIKVVTEKKA
ncbi:MAG: Na+/H+ antiporter NhaC family protein [Clostridia bacterium]|nr:Na+/H+ antiporter NhaC family protein [Clostridia bacterium]